MRKSRLSGEDKIGLSVCAFILCVAALGIIGYVSNIVKAIGMSLSEITVEIVVRLIGIVIPMVGAVAGYF